MMETAATEASVESITLGDMVLVVDQDGAVTTVLEAGERSTAERDFLSRSNVTELWPKPVAKRLLKMIRRALRDRQFQAEEAVNARPGVSYEFICVPQGRNRAMLVIRDLSQVRIERQKVEELAYNDDVTKLPNRQYLFGELDRITEWQRLQEGRAALICLHVEQFDDDGHALIAGCGDEILKELASRLAMQLRGINDTTQKDFERFSIVARTDFRQFAIVLPSIESGEDAESVTMRLLGALGQPISFGTRETSVAAHAGIALFPQDGTESAELYANAVAAVEDARNSADDVYRFHSGTVRLRALQRQDLDASLRSALEREEYALNFLPVADARSGEVRSLEALLRWPSAILGTRTTRKVVAIAEYTGLIVDIGQWVLRRACEELKVWQYTFGGSLRIAVNLSAQEFAKADLADRVSAVLEETGIAPEHLELEIRENMVVRDALQRFSTCRSLREIGVGLVVDDYGTGASALSQLSECPIDALKIDSSFVANIETSEQDQSTCAAAISVAHSLGRTVIAEGVETTAQAEFLREKGCDYLQGFLLTRPLAANAVAGYLREHKTIDGEARVS